MFARIKEFIKGVVIVIIAPFIALGLIVLLGMGGPVVFLMFFALYFVIGPLLQFLVRAVPQDAPENQPTPWPQYWAMAFTFVLRTGAVLALFRLLLWTLLILVAKKGDAAADGSSFIFLPQWDWFFGGCGLLYAFLSFAQEGLWLHRQSLAVRDLPPSRIAAVAVGLSEITGTVRRLENRDGPLAPDQAVMHFYWQLLGTQRQGDTIMLGTYDKRLRPFYLEDNTGRILVDPVHTAVELRRPLGSSLTVFFGRRSFEILLTKRTQGPSWYERRYALNEGDRVYVIGYVEVNPAAPPDATGPDRLVVRPREEARSGYEALLQFLVPGRTPARTPHDIFIIADTTETEAKQLLRKNFLASAAMSLLLAVLAGSLIIIA